MKKLFSKIDNTAAKETNSYLGKVFVVGRHTVTVEEVLAEGDLFYFLSPLFAPTRSLSLARVVCSICDPSRFVYFHSAYTLRLLEVAEQTEIIYRYLQADEE